jgi:hypothetical protein
MSYA